MKKSIKITIIVIGLVSASIAALFFFAGSREFTRMNTFKERMAAEREKARMPAQTDTIHPFSLMASRGEIRDCNGNVLATNATVYDISYDPSLGKNDEAWEADIHSLSENLAAIAADRTSDEYFKDIREARSRGRHFMKLCMNVDSASFSRLNQLPMFNKPSSVSGIIIEPKQVRVYPYGQIAKRTIGHFREESGVSYKVGIEGKYDSSLSGKDGYQIVESKWTKWPMRPAKFRKTVKKTVEPTNGSPVDITLDIDLQAKADSVLREVIGDDGDVEGACLVVAQVDNGAIRTMVNLKRYGEEGLGEYYNVAIGYCYEPGSLLDPANVLTALKCGLITSMGDKISYAPGMFGDGKEQMYVDTLKRLIIGEDSQGGSLGIDGMGSFVILNPSKHEWSKSTLRSMGRGYALSGTSMHFLNFYSAIARGGEGICHSLVEKGDGQQRYSVCTKQQADELTATLVESAALRLKGRETAKTIAGKTGMTRLVCRNGKYQTDDGKISYGTSFAGFFPAEAPQYSFICMVYTREMKNARPLFNVPVEAVAGLVNEMYSGCF